MWPVLRQQQQLLLLLAAAVSIGILQVQMIFFCFSMQLSTIGCRNHHNHCNGTTKLLAFEKKE